MGGGGGRGGAQVLDGYSMGTRWVLQGTDGGRTPRYTMNFFPMDLNAKGENHFDPDAVCMGWTW